MQTSGRLMKVWKDLIELQGDRILLGSGYGAFWVLESFKMYILYMTYIWLPRQAHNGYLDVLLDNGILGFSLLIMIITSFFFRYFNNFVISEKIWMYIILAALILNFQESSFFSGTSVVGVMFAFAYIFIVPQIGSKEE